MRLAILLIIIVIIYFLPVHKKINWIEFDDEYGYMNNDFSHISTGNKEILLVGDSYVYGLGINQEKNLGNRLRVLLPDYEVIDIGVCGWGTDQELKFIDNYPRKPEAAILVFSGNDFYDNRYYEKELYKWERLGNKVLPNILKTRFKKFLYFIATNGYAPVSEEDWKEVLDKLNSHLELIIVSAHPEEQGKLSCLPNFLRLNSYDFLEDGHWTEDMCEYVAQQIEDKIRKGEKER